MTREDINDIINAICPNDEDYEKPCISPKYLRQELEQLALEQRQWNEESTTKNDLALIHTEGLDDEIRCTMCTNSMKSDRGCDGSCVVNKDMYKAVMDAIEKRIQPTTKNDTPHCQHTDEEIAKSFIEDVEAVKDQLPCGEQMDFPNTFDEFAKDYGFRDKKEIYTNGSELISVFRVKQWLEHISTTKNNLGVEKIVDVLGSYTDLDIPYKHKIAEDILNNLPSVTPQEPRKGHWIRVDKDKLKCSKCDVIHFIAQYPQGKIVWCPNCGAIMESEDKE